MATAERTERLTGARYRIGWVELLLTAALVWLALIAYAEWRSEGRYLWLFGARCDLGKVQAGKTIRHRAWVINPTPHSLELGLQPSCGCTVAEQIPQVLKPFWGFPITITVDTTGKSPGRKSERVELIVRDGSRGVSWRESLEVRYSVAEPASPSTHHR
jgi:hypothetical protein